MKLNTPVFEADAEGFRALNADRPAAHLVRELVQNALDETGVTALDVTVTYHGPRKGTTVKVVDNAPGGVADMKLLFTIWLSNKEDSPTKRGRMGRGLKELVSVCDETTIRSVSCDALVFERFQGGRWERKVKPKLGCPSAGTEVTAFCRGWGEKAAKGIVEFLRRIRAPSTVAMRVGYLGPEGPRKCEVCSGVGQTNPGEEISFPCPACSGAGSYSVLATVAPFTASEAYALKLPTVMFESVNGERVERERIRETAVECFTPPPGEKAYVYEMGIPVEECESPVSIDVGQRVVLRERRDTLTEKYKRHLFAAVLSARVEVGRVSDEQFRDNSTLIAAQSYDHLSSSAKLKIAKVWTEGKPFASDSKYRSIATGQHIEVVNLRGLPEGVREIVRSWGTDVKDVLNARKSEWCPPLKTLTPEQAKLVVFFEWVAKGIGRPCAVKPSAGLPGNQASFEPQSRVMALYVEALGKGWFKEPAGAPQLGLLIHELSHWQSHGDEHGSGFAHDNDDVGGLVASFLLNNAEQARLLLNAAYPETMKAAIEEVTP